MKFLAYYLIIALCWVGYSVLLFEKVAPEVHPTEVVLGAVAFVIGATIAVFIAVLCVLIPVLCAPKLYRRIVCGKQSQ